MGGFRSDIALGACAPTHTPRSGGRSRCVPATGGHYTPAWEARHLPGQRPRVQRANFDGWLDRDRVVETDDAKSFISGSFAPTTETVPPRGFTSYWP